MFGLSHGEMQELSQQHGPPVAIGNGAYAFADGSSYNGSFFQYPSDTAALVANAKRAYHKELLRVVEADLRLYGQGAMKWPEREDWRSLHYGKPPVRRDEMGEWELDEAAAFHRLQSLAQRQRDAIAQLEPQIAKAHGLYVSDHHIITD